MPFRLTSCRYRYPFRPIPGNLYYLASRTLLPISDLDLPRFSLPTIPSLTHPTYDPPRTRRFCHPDYFFLPTSLVCLLQLNLSAVCGSTLIDSFMTMTTVRNLTYCVMVLSVVSSVVGLGRLLSACSDESDCDVGYYCSFISNIGADDADFEECNGRSRCFCYVNDVSDIRSCILAVEDCELLEHCVNLPGTDGRVCADCENYILSTISNNNYNCTQAELPTSSPTPSVTPSVSLSPIPPSISPTITPTPSFIYVSLVASPSEPVPSETEPFPSSPASVPPVEPPVVSVSPSSSPSVISEPSISISIPAVPSEGAPTMVVVQTESPTDTVTPTETVPEEPSESPTSTPSLSASDALPDLSESPEPSSPESSPDSPSASPSATATVSLGSSPSTTPMTPSPSMSSASSSFGAVSQSASPSTGSSSDPAAEETDEPICIDAEALSHLPAHELVFDEHRRTAVLCDRNGSCATPGHVVVYQQRPMLMKSYCDMVATCKRTVKFVNSPKFKRALRISSRTDDLHYTALAARYETRAEELVLTTILRMGV